MATATAAPLGFGHVYESGNYVDGWRAVTDPAGWTDESIDALKRHLAANR
jgi:uncharacterized membrane protein